MWTRQRTIRPRTPHGTARLGRTRPRAGGHPRARPARAHPPRRRPACVQVRGFPRQASISLPQSAGPTAGALTLPCSRIPRRDPGTALPQPDARRGRGGPRFHEGPHRPLLRCLAAAALGPQRALPRRAAGTGAGVFPALALGPGRGRAGGGERGGARPRVGHGLRRHSTLRGAVSACGARVHSHQRHRRLCGECGRHQRGPRPRGAFHHRECHLSRRCGPCALRRCGASSSDHPRPSRSRARTDRACLPTGGAFHSPCPATLPRRQRGDWVCVVRGHVQATGSPPLTSPARPPPPPRLQRFPQARGVWRQREVDLASCGGGRAGPRDGKPSAGRGGRGAALRPRHAPLCAERGGGRSV